MVAQYSAALRRGLIEALLPGYAGSLVECIPRHYAAASLKRRSACTAACTAWCIPRHYAAASLKHSNNWPDIVVDDWYSAALRRGLIEAREGKSYKTYSLTGIPRHYAAASLKLYGPGWPFSWPTRIPRHYAAASLKPAIPVLHTAGHPRIPRHYAAASLKHMKGPLTFAI